MIKQLLALLLLILVTLKDTLLELVGSKKFLVMFSGVLTAALAHYHYDVAPEKVLAFLGTVSTYLIGQGIADHGKGAAEVQVAPRMGVLESIAAPVALPDGSTPPPGAGGSLAMFHVVPGEKVAIKTPDQAAAEKASEPK